MNVVAFVYRGDKLETPSSASQIAKSLIAIAEAREWDELRVRGAEALRREVWFEALSRGIHIGYKPSEVDKVELEHRNAFTHDILRRPEGGGHVGRQLNPSARIVASGLQWARGWGAPGQPPRDAGRAALGHLAQGARSAVEQSHRDCRAP